MKKFGLFFSLLILVSCQTKIDKNASKLLKEEKSNEKNVLENSHSDSLNRFIIFDTSNAYLKVNLNSDKGIIEQKFRNVIYGEESLLINDNLVFTYKKETYDISRIAGFEGQSCTITIDFFNKETGSLIKTIRETVDNIKVCQSYYVSTNWGCCGAESEGFLINVSSNKKILDFNEDYFIASIPNSRIELYWGYKPIDRKIINGKYELNEGLIIGKLNYASLDGIINYVIFHAKDEETYQGILHWTPEMRFQLPGKDKLHTNHAELWSNYGAKTSEEIRGFSFQIIFINDNNGGKDTINYKIQNGFLNGIKNEVIHDTIKFTAPNMPA